MRTWGDSHDNRRLARGRLPILVFCMILALGGTAYADIQVSLTGTENLGPIAPDAQGRFAFPNVPLRKNSVNTFTVTAQDGSGRRTSQDITITQVSLENVVVSRVTTERLSQQRIEQLVNEGVIDLDDPSNFNVSTFQIVLTIGTQPFVVDIPIATPKTEETGYEVYSINDPGGSNGPTPNPPTQVIVFEQPVTSGPGLPQPPPIPGVIIIQGDIKTLKEFFSVRLLLMNTSGLFTLSNVKAEIQFPDGGLTCILPADNIADFGAILPGDGEAPGQAEKEFIVRGDEIGVRGVRIAFGGEVTGPGIPEDQGIPFNGAAQAKLEVLGPPQFLVQVQHPPEVTKNVPYELIVDITNAGELPALYASLKLDVGADAELMDFTVDPVTMEPVLAPVEGAVVRNLGHIQPGETVRQVFTINPFQTGVISSCFGVSDYNITLQVGMGDKGCLTGQRPVPGRVPDGTPTVSVVPTPNAQGVGIDSPVVAFFSERMQYSTITAGGSFQVTDKQGNVAPGEIRFEEIGNGTVAIWQFKDNITNRLSPDTEYRVLLSNTIQDVDGNGLANQWFSIFTTTNPDADKDPPQTSLSVLPPVNPNYVLPGQIVRLNAYAADQGSGVGRLELRVRDMDEPDSQFVLIDQKTVFQTTPFPLIFAVDSAKLQLGHTYIYKLTAFDKLGNAQDATVAVIMAPSAAPPTIVLPDDPATPTPQGISFSIAPVSVSAGVREVYYFYDGNTAAFAKVTLAPFQTVLPTLGLAPGIHSIKAIAVDGLGQLGEDTLSFTISENNNPPVARILGPPNGVQLPKGAVLTVSAEVQDDVGVAFVGFHLNDEQGPVFATGLGPATVNTANLPLGSHRIIVHAINKLGKSSNLNDPAAILNFVVVEPPPGAPPSAPTINNVSPPINGLSTLAGTTVPGAQVLLSNITRAISVEGVANGAGAFSLSIEAQSGDTLSVVVFDLTQSPLPSAPSTAVVPEAPTLLSFAVTPNNLVFSSLNVTSSLTATAHYSDGSQVNVTSQATYSTSAPGVAAVNNSGTVVSLGNGTATITVSFGGMTAQIVVTVNVVTLTALSVEPTSILFTTLEQTNGLLVKGHYSNGSVQPLNGAVFSTANPAVATVNASGLVTAKANGSTTITVSVPSLPPVQVPVTVDSSLDTPPEVVLLSPAPGTTVERGDTVTVVAKATDAVGGVKSLAFTASGATAASEVRTVTPASGNTTQTFTFVVSSAAPVGETIAVQVVAKDTQEQESAPASLALTVVDETPPAAVLLQPGPDSQYNFGDTVTIEVQGVDAVGVTELRYTAEGGVTSSGSEVVEPAQTAATATFSFVVPHGASDPDVTIRGYARDAAGNEAASAPVRVIITDADITPPETIVTTVSNPGVNASATVSYEILDGASDIAHVELYFRRNGIGTFNRYTDAQGGNPLGEFMPQGTNAGSIVFNSTRMGGDGVYEFFTVGVDEAGNREPVPTESGAIVGDLGALAVFNTGAEVIVLTTNQEIEFSNYDNRNLRIVGATVTLKGSHSFKNVELLNGAKLIHRETSLDEEPGLTFSAWSLSIDATSAIDLNGRGYLAGRHSPNSGPYEGRTLDNLPGSSYRSGGSHGGIGAGYGGAPNAIYGSLTDPVDLGSGGSGGAAGNAGGDGGGRLTLQAINVACDGAIAANGEQGTGWQAGSGSGGSIKLEVATLSGLGLITANGGGGEVPGGGGRIAVRYVDLYTYDSGKVRALGGQGGYGTSANGTVFMAGVEEIHGTLVVDGQGANSEFLTVPMPPGVVFDNLILRNNARVTIDDPIVVSDTVQVLNGSILTHSVSNEAGLSISADTVVVDATSTIDVTGKGYRAGRSPGNSADYAGRTLGDRPGATYRSGGSYGGFGANLDGATNPPYGSPMEPVHLGAGGSGGGAGNAGGNGGGRVTIHAVSEVVIEGGILANGGAGTGWQAGSGSGGSVLIVTSFLHGAGTIAANGGVNEVGGSGGRVACFYDALGGSGDDFGQLLRITAFGGHGNYAAGSAGTVLLARSDQTYGDLYIDDNMAGQTAPLWTPLTPIGYGKIAALTADTLTVDGNVAFAPGGLVGLDVNPNRHQNLTFRIVANTLDTVTVDISGGVPLTAVASVGDEYVGVYRFDNVTFRRGGYLVLGDELEVTGTLKLQENSRLEHFDATTTFEPHLSIAADIVEIAPDSGIFVDGRGYLAGRHLSNAAPYEGRTLGNVFGSTYRSGGSYGGLGARLEGVPGPVYGSIVDPAALGSGGSGGGAGNAGGDGGGWVEIRANTMVVNGVISANGEAPAGWQAGGGSGGTINLRVGHFTGDGILRVNGGGTEVGGGGGRIAVVYDAMTFDIARLQARAGSGNYAKGGNGTIFLREQGQPHGDLIIDGANLSTPFDTTPIPPGYIFRTMKLMNNARVVSDEPIRVVEGIELLGGSVLTHSRSHEPGLVINADTLYVDATSAIDVSSRGYVGGRTAPYSGDYAGRTLGDLPGAVYRSGGSYGGYGGVFEGTGTNPPYGTPENPVYLGSGGSGGGSGNPGGAGGGRVTLNIATRATIDGLVAANGGPGTGWQSGAGSGGSILIHAGKVEGTGLVTADGGGPEVGGGGGRVAIIYDELGTSGYDFNGMADVRARAGAGNYAPGSAGTVLLRQTSQAVGDLYIDGNTNNAVASHWTPLTCVGPGKIAALTNNTLTVDGNVPMIPDGLVGVEINPNVEQDETFIIVSNTADTLTVDVSGGTTLTDVAAVGDTYRGVHRFDNVFLRRGGVLVLGDLLIANQHMKVDDYARITHYDATRTYEPFLDLIADYFELGPTGSLDVSARGYLAGRSPLNPMSYEGLTLGNVAGSTYRSGGSYGGLGGKLEGTPNSIYGNADQPAALGSGGSGGGAGNAGGDGGGWIRVRANEALLHGAMHAAGAPGTGWQAGGGSGGTIDVQAPSVHGAGLLAADGGGNEVGGGGGRVRILFDPSLSDISALTLRAAAGPGNWSAGQTGTTRLITQPQSGFPSIPPKQPDMPADLNGDKRLDSRDIQLAVNAALGFNVEGLKDPNGDGTFNALDVQITVNAVLGF